jgi:hypothetical protein
MDPQLLNLITGFTLEMIHEFKAKGEVPTEAEIASRFENHYASFLLKNKNLQEETDGNK